MSHSNHCPLLRKGKSEERNWHPLSIPGHYVLTRCFTLGMKSYPKNNTRREYDNPHFTDEKLGSKAIPGCSDSQTGHWKQQECYFTVSPVLYFGRHPWQPARCPLTVHETPDVLSKCHLQSHTGKPLSLITDRLYFDPKSYDLDPAWCPNLVIRIALKKRLLLVSKNSIHLQ